MTRPGLLIVAVAILLPPRALAQSGALEEGQAALAKQDNDRGVCYAQMGWYDQAQTDPAEAVRQDPKGAAARNARGLIYQHYRQQGDYAKALAAFTEALILDPQNVEYAAHRDALGRIAGGSSRADRRNRVTLGTPE